jgi:hypothetical protein
MTKWEKMDFQYFKKIIKSINKYRLNPKFLSIFWGTQCKLRKNWFNTDIVLLNWNLFLILVILIALNNLSVVRVTNVEYEKDEEQATCMNTHYGCCPDGVNSKINFFGTLNS